VVEWWWKQLEVLQKMQPETSTTVKRKNVEVASARRDSEAV
jgi:hypothetical protein